MFTNTGSSHQERTQPGTTLLLHTLKGSLTADFFSNPNRVLIKDLKISNFKKTCTILICKKLKNRHLKLWISLTFLLQLFEFDENSKFKAWNSLFFFCSKFWIPLNYKIQAFEFDSQKKFTAWKFWSFEVLNGRSAEIMVQIFRFEFWLAHLHRRG